jgi:hypothetical protein
MCVSQEFRQTGLAPTRSQKGGFLRGLAHDRIINKASTTRMCRLPSLRGEAYSEV